MSKLQVIISCMFLLILALSHSVNAEIISENIELNYNNILVVDNYSPKRKSGMIRIKACAYCQAENLKLDEHSVLILKDQQVSMNNLLHTRLKYPSKSVRIQYNRLDNTVSYIRWQPNQDQKEGLL